MSPVSSISGRRSPTPSWIGDLPHGWHLKPAKAVFAERREKSRPDDVHLTPSQAYGVLPQAEYIERTGNRVVLNLTGGDQMRHVEPGDFVSHLRSFQGGLEGSQVRGKVSAAYTVLAPRREICSDYYKFLFKSVTYVQGLQTTTDQLRDGQSIRYSQFALLPLPVPPLEEQCAIAEFLRQETAKIDEFIADQEELIRLFEERRAATISEAVTKGLDPEVPMKSSGNQWIDEVPAHWTVNRFSRCVRVVSGQVDPRSPRFIDMVLIAPNHVEAGTGRLIEMETAREQGADSGKYLVAKGQVVYSKIRPALSKVIIAPVACLCSADMYALDGASRDLTNEFIRWYLLGRPFTNYAIDQSARVAMPKLNQDTLGAAPICYPPLEEQKRICAFVEQETEEIDSAIRDANEAIELLIERRASLISAAVTGMIDVRERVKGA